MNATMSVSLIWLFAMLASAAHSAPVRRARHALVAGLAAYFTAFGLALQFAPQPNWIGVVIGVIAIWRLIAGPMPRGGNGLAGATAGLGAALAAAGGLPWQLAAGLGGLMLVCAVVMQRFLTRVEAIPREQVLVMTAIGAPLTGLASDLAYGWHSAVTLNHATVEKTANALPEWVLIIIGLALLAGLIRGAWVQK